LLTINSTGIEYLDATWNPLVGCSGAGCDVKEVCWARGQAKRQKPKYNLDGTLQRGCELCYKFEPHYHPDRIEDPLRVRKPLRIGVCFSGDLFDYRAAACESTRAMRQLIFETMAQASWHTFVLLTKQPQNIPETLVFSPNVWLGVSVNRVDDLWRLQLLKIKTLRNVQVKVVSFEPLKETLGSVDLQGISWVIIGAQRKPDFQPQKNWVTSLVLDARLAGAKVFFKNNLACRAAVEYQEQCNLQEIPRFQVNKKRGEEEDN
jgi:protein gp37